MHFSMERWHSAAEARFSARKYREGPNQDELAALEAAADMMHTKGVRIALGHSEGVFKPMFLWYGKITGTACFAAIIASDTADQHSIGYLGEAFILEVTALGLGTCWVGGTYSKAEAARQIALEDGERIVAVTPLGVRAESYVGRPRKSLSDLTGLTQQQLLDLPEWQQSALSSARIAPSAVNRQPWRFVVGENSITIRQSERNFGYAGVDIGIAMLHVELGAAHCSVSGEWRDEGESVTFVKNE
ncbi:MAG: nitroreductase family protein [Christensenellaceae bacterium]|jgi:nitroreductase|nr:nitroreductase family protein [Christensenellaceae bacterium]